MPRVSLGPRQDFASRGRKLALKSWRVQGAQHRDHFLARNRFLPRTVFLGFPYVDSTLEHPVGAEATGFPQPIRHHHIRKMEAIVVFRIELPDARYQLGIQVAGEMAAGPCNARNTSI